MQVSLNFLFSMHITTANFCLTIPVATASVKRNFSQLKMIKTRLRNRLGEKSLSHLMKISIESPEKISENDLENMWMRGTEKKTECDAVINYDSYYRTVQS